MKQLLFISLFLFNICYGQRIIVNGHKHGGAPEPPSEITVAQFSFGRSPTGAAATGWVAVWGRPDSAIITGSDNRSGSSITISTVNTGIGFWQPVVSSATADDNWGEQHADSVYYFTPKEATKGGWGNNATYSPGGECILLGGLNTSKTYRLELGASRTTGNPSRSVVYVLVDNAGTRRDTLNVKNNTRNIAEFTNCVPNGSGQLKLHFYRLAADNSFGGYLMCIRIKEEVDE